jgi:predicted outer membrane lipoprotein
LAQVRNRARFSSPPIARAAPTEYRGTVSRRSPKLLAFVLVAVQWLLGGPLAQAFAQLDAPAAETHCADMAPEDQEAPCPCCPDDMSRVGCSSGCLGASGPAPVLSITPVKFNETYRSDVAAAVRVAPGDPPLKPPPIV